MKCKRLSLGLAVAILCGFRGCTILSSDFERSPRQAGWSYKKYRGDEHDDPWTVRQAASGSFAIKARPGFLWESPAIRVTPGQYYRVTFQSMTWAEGFWAAIFYDRDGERMLSDHFGCVEPSKAWRQNVVCIEAKARARSMRIEFRPIRTELYVDDFEVRIVGRRAVGEWADAVYATMPPLQYAPPPGRWKHLAGTMAKLRAGKKLTVVILGDSIACDMGTSAWDALVERLHPGARIQTVTSTRPSTGCWFYQRPGMVKRYVLDFSPDLVIIGGISTGWGGAVRSVIQQIRAGCDAEILLATGAFGYERHFEDYRRASTQPTQPAPRFNHRQFQQLAREEAVAYLDLRLAFNEYLLHCGKPYRWFARDPIHANARGKQILARVLERYFAPDPKPAPPKDR